MYIPNIGYEDKVGVVPLPTVDIIHHDEEGHYETKEIYHPPIPPVIPDIPDDFNKVKPPFSANLETLRKYTYYFGIDKLQILNRSVNKTNGLVSEPIKLSIDLNDKKEYIKIKAKYYINEYSSMEFFILDGINTIDIIPENMTTIMNEKVIKNNKTKTLLRFIPDESKKIIIKRNGIVLDITLKELEYIFSKSVVNDDVFTVTYSPLCNETINPYKYRPKNDTIKIKVISRIYDDKYKLPYLKNVFVKEFVGDTLWKQI